MHIRNHSRPFGVLLSLFTLLSTQAYAVEFADLNACRLHYRTVVQPGATDTAAADTWCEQTAKMDPLNICADKKLYAFLTNNKLTDTQKTTYRESYRQACYQEKNSQASTAAPATNGTSTAMVVPAGAVIAATAGVTYATPVAAGAPGKPILNLQDCTGITNSNACQAANQSATAAFAAAQSSYNTKLAAYETAQKNATQLTTQQRQQVQQATQGMLLNAGTQALGAFMGGSNSNNGNSVGSATSASNSRVTTRVQNPNGMAPRNVSSSDPGFLRCGDPGVVCRGEENPTRSTAATADTNTGGTNTGGANAGGTNAGGANAGGTNTGGANAGGTNAGGTNTGGTNTGGTNTGGTNTGGTNAGGTNAEGQAQHEATHANSQLNAACPAGTAAGGTGAPQCPRADQVANPTSGPIATSAEQKLNELRTTVNAENAKVGAYTALTAFKTNFNTIAGQITEGFIPKKVSCTAKAQSAEKFCLEGSAPGTVFAKALIDYSGPVLALIRSAHKACSQTAKISNIASMAVTAAKAVCVVNKISCDKTCDEALADAQTISGRISALNGTLNTEATSKCTGAAVVPAVCEKATQEQATAVASIQALYTAMNREGGFDDGTTQALVAHCASKTKDIALMAANILGLVAARGSAEKCEKQLASSEGGDTSTDVSTEEYCAVPANASTQFCICKTNLSGEGCGGLAGTSLPDSVAASNQIGANLQTGSGLSSFAGGNAGGSTGSGSDFGIGSENGATNGITADLTGKSAMGAGPGAAVGAGVGGGSGGGGAGGDPAAAAAAGLKEDKKSVLGTLAGFASSLSGAFGGGGNKGATGNGSLSSQQQAAIQRKIASDKIAGEVTGASGMDNFSKVKKSYVQKAETLMSAP